MSFSATHDIKEQIKNAVDIVDLVGSHLQLRPQGRIYIGSCPWHDDTRPSLQVNPERQSWKCWVCNIGGDVFSFVMKREGVEFREALEMLAERALIELKPGRREVVRAGSPNDKKTLYQASAWAESQFHECVLSSPDAEMARKYLASRGIDDATIRRFRIGFSPNQWQWLVDRSRATTYSIDVLEAVGLVIKSQSTDRPFDRFKGRVIFPIRDVQDRAIAFGGRILPELADDKSAKYVNSPETRLFSKSQQLYALNVVREFVAKQRHAVVVEGYTDAIIARQFGLENVVAVLGTALGSEHIRLLRRFVDTVTLVLDGDDAGQRRANEVLELFIGSPLDLRIVTLPDGLDPCDFLVHRGKDAFGEFLGSAVDALDHRIHIATKGIDLVRDLHRSNQALEQILTTLARAPRNTLDNSAAARLRQQQILGRLSREFRLDESELRERLVTLRQSQSRRAASRGTASAEQRTAEKPAGTIDDPYDRELFEILTQRPDLIADVVATLSRDSLNSEAARRLFDVYVECHRNGDLPDFGHVLTTVDDPDCKNSLVEMDENGRKKEIERPDICLVELLEAYRSRAEEKSCRDKLAVLEQQQLPEQEQLDILNQLLSQKRERQGISAPTEG